MSVFGYETALLVRGPNLHPGKVSVASPDFVELIPGTWKAAITLAGHEKIVFDLNDNPPGCIEYDIVSYRSGMLCDGE